jgi:UDP-N-acetylglucosamine kinase
VSWRAAKNDRGRGRVAHVCGDLYKPFHPDYDRLLAEDDRTAGAYTRLDTRQWHAEAEAYVRDRCCHALVETSLADPDEFATTADRFRASGYRVEVAALAVPAALSRLGIACRYMRQADVDGHGRYVARGNHDHCYAGMVETAARVDQDGGADTVFAFRRGNHPVFQNHRSASGAWSGPQGFADAIEAERVREWTQLESLSFCHGLNRVAQNLGLEWTSELADIAEQARPLCDPAMPLDEAVAGRAEGAYLVAAAESARLREARLVPAVSVPTELGTGERSVRSRPGGHLSDRSRTSHS